MARIRRRRRVQSLEGSGDEDKEWAPAAKIPKQSLTKTPRAVTPLCIGNNYNDQKPSAFVLNSTNEKTKKQWEATCQNLEKIGLAIVPVLGLDGDDIPYMAPWYKAKLAWVLKGFPYILKCIDKTIPGSGQKNGSLLQRTLPNSPHERVLKQSN